MSLYFYGHALEKIPCPGGHEIFNLGGPFLVHYNYTLSFCGPCPGVDKKILKKINFTLFIPWNGGHEIYNFLSPWPTDATY